MSLVKIGSDGRKRINEEGSMDIIADNFLENLPEHVNKHLEVEVEKLPDPDEYLELLGLSDAEMLQQLPNAGTQGDQEDEFEVEMLHEEVNLV